MKTADSSKPHAQPTPAPNPTHQRKRVWDLPTRLFHASLGLCVIALVVTGSVGGALMPWHFKLGYCVATLVMWRVVWGLVGGRWSRFASFIYAPQTVLAYLKGQGKAEHSVGHNPLGAGSVFALLAVLAVQVATGLVGDDEISNVGPLNKWVATAQGLAATAWHKGMGKYVLLALVALHLCAIAFYWFKKRENLVQPMIDGDKLLPQHIEPSRDDAASRAVAGVAFLFCAACVIYVVNWV